MESPQKSPYEADIKSDPSDKSADQPPPYQYEKGLPTALEWIKENITSDPLGRIKRYFISLFPIFSWIYRYNFTWALGGASSIWTKF